MAGFWWPYRWVWSRAGRWSDNELACLLSELRASSYWPLDEVEVLKTLEVAAAIYRDLERWGLLTSPVQGATHQQPAPADDEEIWF